MQSVELVVSTIDDNVQRVPNVFLPEEENVGYRVIHQDPYDSFQEEYLPKEFSRSDVAYHRFVEKGLPSSRNRAIELTNGDIVFPTDDDVQYFKDGIDVVRREFENNPDVDIVTFKARVPDGNARKHYRDMKFVHTYRTLLQVSSYEFAIRLSSAKTLNLKWDNNFGLGARYGGGLEVVFLQEAYKKGASCVFLPEFVVTHPEESSGRQTNAENAFVRGAVYGRVFGWRAPAYCLVFVVRKYIGRQLLIGPVQYFGSMVKGMLDFFLWHNKKKGIMKPK